MAIPMRSLCAALLTTSIFPAVSRRVSMTAQANFSVDDAANQCKVKTVEHVCVCNKKELRPAKLADAGYQCSACQDNSKWGYGCDLECPCTTGCDFSGNCLKPGKGEFPNCKRNSRIEKPTDKEDVLNERGECQACVSGFHGLFCKADCPVNCADTSEGKCSRGGKCYECVDGYFGEICDQSCPESCPKCVMKDGLVKMKGDAVEYLPAGTCPEQCSSDHFGLSCDQPCPTNCKKSHIPSCLKESGLCMKCEGHLFWGSRCEHSCSKGCVSGTCAKDTGVCEKGCQKSWWGDACTQQCSKGCRDAACSSADGTCTGGCVEGFWGDRCEKTCPKGTDLARGCSRDSGFPLACEQGMYPTSDSNGSPMCTACPENCAGSTCNVDGSCNAGCDLGFFGLRCESNCPPHCDGPCDKFTTNGPDGQCKACLDGWTGRKCTKRCHATCRTCDMFNDAVGPKSCASCPEDEPVFLNNGVCECITGASRPGADGKCVCDDPSDPMKVGFYDNMNKICRFVCKPDYWEAIGDKETLCLHSDVFWGIMQAGKALTQDSCPAGSMKNPVQGAKPECVRQDFVDYILKRVK